MTKPTACLAPFPMRNHRTVEQADRDERLEAANRQSREARARPTFRDQLVGVLRLDASF